MAQIAIIGTGYVGLCTAAGFSKLGHNVKCFDVSNEKIDKLQNGDIPIYEEGLQEIISEGRVNGNLSFDHELSLVASDAEFAFICVPTPQDEDGSADLSYVLEASMNVSKFLPDGAVLVVKSTVPVGTSDQVIKAINRPGINYVSNPEFLREGTAMWDFFNPDRIVVGSIDTKSAEAVADLYSLSNVPKILTSAASAELIKYAANSFLAIKLSFVNEVASICEQTGANIVDVASGFGLDSRIGEKFLKPGPGWGGSCFPKDTRALLSTSQALGTPSELVLAAVTSNNKTFDRIVERLASKFDGTLVGKHIGIWGIAFKANTDDTRESPALEIITRLFDAGATISVYDPVATLPSGFSYVEQVSSSHEAVRSKDALMVLTEWPEFQLLEAEDFISSMNSAIVFDTRRILNGSWEAQSELLLVGR